MTPRWVRLARRRHAVEREVRAGERVAFVAASRLVDVGNDAIESWGKALGAYASRRFLDDVIRTMRRTLRTR